MNKIFVSVLLVCLNSISAENSKNSNDLLKYLNFEKADQQFVCPTPDGKYSHRECHKYWKCYNWLAYEFNCSPGLYYNENKKECDWPQNVECSPNPITIEETDTTTELPTTGEPFTCPTQHGLYAHQNCWMFWQCSYWTPYEFLCAKGTAWNDNIKVCDWPQNVGCVLPQF
jgi:hypothetical protein